MSNPTEMRLRRLAKRHGYRIVKSRSRIIRANNLGGCMLIDNSRNACILGSQYDASLDRIADYLSEAEAA